ncbi:hypothetical protein Droror1_Dr00016606 [Drosera rotundifolia]
MHEAGEHPSTTDDPVGGKDSDDLHQASGEIKTQGGDRWRLIFGKLGKERQRTKLRVAVDMDELGSFGGYSSMLLPKLCALLGESKNVFEPATQSLVNLSQKSDLAGKMVSMGMVKTCMDVLYKGSNGIERLMVRS